MIVLVDATCARMGGIATYAENLLRHWPLEFPGDEIHVLAPEGAQYPGCVVHELAFRRPSAVWRPVTTTRAFRRLERALQPDAILATLPSTSMRKPGVPMVVVVHDLRHELKPEQFPWSRRLLRSVSYTRGYQVADAFIAVSHRTLSDLRRLHPETAAKPAAVVYHGADHVDAWRTGQPQPFALAFAHHSNKNLPIVLEAWQQLADPPELAVVGMADPARVELASNVRAHPYLPKPEFEALMASASLIVFPSEAEGFGLPVLESMRLGIPVVIGPDPAVIEVSGGHATTMREFSAAALADAVTVALTSAPAPRAYTDRFTWAAAVRATRQTLLDQVDSRMAPKEVG